VNATDSCLSSKCVRDLLPFLLQVYAAQDSEVKRLNAQLQASQAQLREAQEAEYAARRKCQELIDSAAPSQKEFNDLERRLAREVAERKKLEAELERLSLERFFGGTYQSTSSASVTVLGGHEASNLSSVDIDIVLSELAKVLCPVEHSLKCTDLHRLQHSTACPPIATDCHG
jgi:DNA repair exonuclease SbcCD ATPase subunit